MQSHLLALQMLPVPVCGQREVPYVAVTDAQELCELVQDTNEAAGTRAQGTLSQGF